MKCKNCKNEIPDGSLFCNLCGHPQVRQRRKKATKKLSVPEPVQLKSGSYRVQIRDKAGSHSFTASTAEAATKAAMEYRLGLTQDASSPLTLSKAIDKYIERKENVLSVLTVRTIRNAQKHRFQNLMGRQLNSRIDWQAAVNAEAAVIAPKTLKTAWGIVCSVLRAEGIEPPFVQLPIVVRKEKDWLDYEQILKFIEVIRGEDCEIGALLALHSLRSSEIAGLLWDDIDLEKRLIHVHSSIVPDEHHHLVRKNVNKNAASTRYVPIMIPQLFFRLASVEPKTGPVLTYTQQTLLKRIKKVCIKNDLPPVGIHGLRHSFASLAYHLSMPEAAVMSIGGWSDRDTVHSVYLHLAEKDRLLATNEMTAFYTSNHRFRS